MVRSSGQMIGLRAEALGCLLVELNAAFERSFMRSETPRKDSHALGHERERCLRRAVAKVHASFPQQPQHPWSYSNTSDDSTRADMRDRALNSRGGSLDLEV